MRKIILLSFLFSIGLQVIAQKGKIEKVYVGTFTSLGAEGIYLCDFNSKTGDIHLNKTFKGIDNPAFLKISNDRKYLYAVSRKGGGTKSEDLVLAYRIETDGQIILLNKQEAKGKDPCHVDVTKDGKFVAVANYGSGTMSLFEANINGELSAATCTIISKGSSINEKRQTAPHAHSIKFSPFNNWVFSADLGTDKLNIFNLSGNKLVPSEQEYVKLKAGAGPRHFEFHQGGKTIYVINELNSTVSVLDNQNGKWKIVQNISTLPSDFKGESFCADIHISSDGKYLYGSNRGHNSIAVFKVDPKSNQLELKTTVSVEGDWPRNFALSPNGKFMLVANQNSGNITVFKINRKTGIPEFTGKEIELPAPVCLEFL